MTTPPASVHRFAGTLTSGGGVARSLATAAGEPLAAWAACHDGTGYVNDCLTLVTRPLPGLLVAREVRAAACLAGSAPGACFAGRQQPSTTQFGATVRPDLTIEAWSLQFATFPVRDLFGTIVKHASAFVASTDGIVQWSSSGQGYVSTVTMADGSTHVVAEMASPDGSTDCDTQATLQAKALYDLRIAEAGQKATVLLVESVLLTALGTIATGGPGGIPALGASFTLTALFYNQYITAAKAEADLLEAKVKAACSGQAATPDPGDISIPDLNTDPGSTGGVDTGSPCSISTGVSKDSYAYDSASGECCGMLETLSCSGFTGGSGECVLLTCGWEVAGTDCQSGWSQEECESLNE